MIQLDVFNDDEKQYLNALVKGRDREKISRQDILKAKRLLPVIMLVTVFVLSAFFSVNVIFLIIAAGIVGYLDFIVQRRKKG